MLSKLFNRVYTSIVEVATITTQQQPQQRTNTAINVTTPVLIRAVATTLTRPATTTTAAASSWTTNHQHQQPLHQQLLSSIIGVTTTNNNFFQQQPKLQPIQSTTTTAAFQSTRPILTPLISLGGFSLATYNATVADGYEQFTFLKQLAPMTPSIVADLKLKLERIEELEDLSNHLIVFIERQKDEIRRLQHV
jgi:hypothetical protein